MSDSTLFLDTSALLRRYVADAERPLVIETMNSTTTWVASSLARTELQLALHSAAGNPAGQRDLWAAVRDDWEAIWEVPTDARCLARATEIGARYGLALVDSLHLAAAARLPGTVRFLTFERQQIPAAADLGFDVVSPGTEI